MSKVAFKENPIIELERRMFRANLMMDVAVPQKDPDFVLMPSERPPGWIAYQDRVAFIIRDQRGGLRIRTGHIASTAGTSHAGVDNVSKTIVWCDQRLNDLADNADDAHEECFDPKDPRLIRLDEVKALRYLNRITAWFQGVYSSEEIQRLSELFLTFDFGRQQELEEEAEAWRLGMEAARKKLGWYGEDGQFHPPVNDSSTIVVA
ncbi:MAG: hypothetical protein AAB365_02260 [Patescibacteria group bacterium]